jgi:teichuronic acid biosynthesis glycosyltransferase TuaC
MSPRLHVALVTSFYPNSAEPLRAVFVRHLIAACERYADISVVSPVPYAPPLPRIARWRSLRQIPARVRDGAREVLHPRYGVIPKCDVLSGCTYFAAIGRILQRIHASRRIDVVHAHCAYPDAVGAGLAAGWLGIPFAVTAHGSDINVYARRPLIRRQVRATLRRAGVVFAVSRALRDRIEALLPPGSTRVMVLPCAGVDPELFRLRDRSRTRTRLGVAPQGRIVLFAGRLVPVKAVEVLLGAWARLQARQVAGAGDCLLIAGEGPERKRLERLVQASGECGRVRFLGEVRQSELAQWLNAATVLCLPSRSEGTPNVVIEALASGLPVVASRVGGIPELISEPGNGLLVAPGDEELLAASLQRALATEWNAAQIAASVAHFTWDDLARRNMQALQALVADRAELESCVG